MDYAERERNPVRHLPSITMVVVLHLALGYALVTGLARKVVDVIKQPLETKIIEEIKKPPPDTPPPVAPPKVEAPPAPQPVVRKEYKASYRVDPQFPRQAISQGLSGRVIAWVHVAPSGGVTNVEIRQSSNRLFDREVIRALSQWRFNPEPVGFIGEYEIVFNLQD